MLAPWPPLQAASAEDWCAGAPLPDGILKHVAHTLGNLSQQVR